MELYNSALWAMCCRCQMRLSRRDVISCPTCSCPIYCSAKCRDKDSTPSSSNPHAHGNWCSDMRSFMQLERELIDLPFSFAKTTTSREFDSQQLSLFLMQRGVLGKGMWRRECLLWMPPTEDFFESPVPPPGEFPEEENVFPWVLPGESVALDAPPDSPVFSDDLEDWASYYLWRGFSLNSAIAILQQWPLTIFYIFTRLFREHHPERFAAIAKKGEVTIHLLGAEKEAELLSALQELGFLLPKLRIILVLVGKEISSKVDRTVIVKKNVRFQLRKGSYHTLTDLGTPDLAIALNAGLAAFFSWPETVRLLQRNAVPSYFSDYCPVSVELSRRMIEAQQLGTISPVILNPFRSPLRVLSDQNNLPWFSNALLFRLLPNT